MTVLHTKPGGLPCGPWTLGWNPGLRGADGADPCFLSKRGYATGRLHRGPTLLGGEDQPAKSRFSCLDVVFKAY